MHSAICRGDVLWIADSWKCRSRVSFLFNGLKSLTFCLTYFIKRYFVSWNYNFRLEISKIWTIKPPVLWKRVRVWVTLTLVPQYSKQYKSTTYEAGRRNQNSFSGSLRYSMHYILCIHSKSFKWCLRGT